MITSKVLNSGARLVVDEMKGFEGVSFKLFIFVGSSNEKKEEDYGISHLIEHMFFKGTKTRSSFDIVKEFDKLGIQTNAYTSKTATCYFTYGTTETLEKSVEITSDMLFNSVYDETELEREKQVVLEEIKMYEDLPDSVCEILMDSTFYNNLSYAHDILGTEKSVLNITRNQILDYLKENYIPKNIVLSFAGNVDFKTVEKLVNKYFESKFTTQSFFKYDPITIDFAVEKKQNVVLKETNQAQIKISYKTENLFNEHKTRLNSLISAILGGGMSSRLFQEVREKLGLVYNISSQNETSPIAGMFSIMFGSTHKNIKLALKTIKNVIKNVVDNGFTQEELTQAKNMLITNIKLQGDSPSNMATRNAYQLQNNNRIISKEDLINFYKNITIEEINIQAKNIFTQNYCITMVSSKTENLIEEYENL